MTGAAGAQPLQFVNSNEITAEQDLDLVHLDFVGGCVLKNQVVINQVNNPIFQACSSKNNKPAFEVRFLDENSILLIRATSYPAGDCSQSLDFVRTECHFFVLASFSSNDYKKY
jgi:hypothetical protein